LPTLTLSEADLIAACVRGEHRAQRQLYDQLAGLMLTVCRRYLKHREDAEEALILGFAKMFRALPNYRFAGSFEGWVRRIMVNESLMQLRQRELMTVSFEDFAQPVFFNDTAATENLQNYLRSDSPMQHGTTRAIVHDLNAGCNGFLESQSATLESGTCEVRFLRVWYASFTYKHRQSI